MECEGLADTGSTGSLMDIDFFMKNFPGAETEKTETTLKYASGSARTRVKRMVQMSFQMGGGQDPITFEQTFFLIPQLAFDLYLGQGFFRSPEVMCLNSSGVYTSRYGIRDRRCLDQLLESLKGIERSPIHFLPRPPSVSNVTGTFPTTKVRMSTYRLPLEHTPSLKPTHTMTPNTAEIYEGKVLNETCTHQEASPEENSYSRENTASPPGETRTTPTLPGKNFIQKDISRLVDYRPSNGMDVPEMVGTGNLLTSRTDPLRKAQSFGSTTWEEFNKMVDTYHIDENEKTRMFWEYRSTGRTQIPVSNYIEEATEPNGLTDVVENYYDDLNGLMEILDLHVLPSGPREMVRDFLKDNLEVFSRSEVDIGFVPGYEATVSLRREIRDFNVKFNPFPAAVRPKVRAILHRFHERGIISYADALIKDPIVSNLIAVKKPNGQVRLAFDGREINYLATKGRCYHRSLSQTLREIDLNSKYFSVLDLSSAYFSISLHPDSRRYFCFRDADNKLCLFNRIVQGFVESDQHLSKVLE